MKLPDSVLDTISRYVEMFPLWEMPAGPAAEERARNWTLGLIAQIVFEHPDDDYGSKRADATRPLSKDSIAQKQEGGKLFSWDVLSGTGTGEPTLVDDPDSTDITGQIFAPIEGRDVIDSGFQPPAPGNGGESGGSGIPYDENKSIQFGLGCNDVYNQSGAAMDAGMISVHSQRCAWDYYVGGLSWDESYKKHINEFRAVYGLPPV